eukprot:TRINITY_DN7363_c0_g1_i1.p1 TRINITY_DN7363_c0_g1~~TRINITY_DN7363_c0_g1_i1.p1  ORF type:complete len:290 (-),score=9.67 TRINITY_DN7363_c0_g1_i1:58-927(-)
MFIDHWDHRQYDISHHLLAVGYTLLAFVSLIVFVRGMISRHLSIWASFFYPFLMIGCCVRSVYFVLLPGDIENWWNVSGRVMYVLNSLPSFVIFTNYLILLFIWVEIYHFSHGKPSDGHKGDRLKRLFFGINGVMYLILVVLYILALVVEHFTLDTTNYAQIAMAIFISVLYLLTTVGFLIYGSRLYFKFVSMPVYTKSRRRVLRKIQIICALVSLCFLTRMGVDTITIALNKNPSIYAWGDFVYYFPLDVLPLALMVYLLHGHKTAEAHQKYHNQRESLLQGHVVTIA